MPPSTTFEAPPPVDQRRFALLLFVAVGAAYSLLAWRATGAGRDPDAWRLALAGLDSWQTGQYVPSRPPGFPVVEILAAVTAPMGTLAFKLLTAWAGAACAAATYALAARQDVRAARAAAILLAASPAMILASTMTMDYVWSLGLLLGGMLLARRGRGLAAGLVIGLAAGCRVTALAGLPAAVLLLWPSGGRRSKGVAQLLGSALGAAGLMYAAVLHAHPMLLAATHVPPSTQLVQSVKGLPFGLFGGVGFAVLVVAAVAAVLLPRRRERPAFASPHPPLERAALWAMIVGFALVYAVAPHEPLYLLPVLPALFILLSRRLSRTVALALAAALLFSNYRDVRSLTLVHGGVVQDFRDRERTAQLAEYFLVHPPQPPALVIAGYRAPVIQYASRTASTPLPPGVRVGYLLQEEMFRAEHRPGEKTYCLKDMIGECRKRGFDPLAAGAEVWWPPAGALANESKD